MCQLIQIRHTHCNVLELQPPRFCPQAPSNDHTCREGELISIIENTCPGPAFCSDTVRYIYRSPGLSQHTPHAASGGQAGVFVLKVEDYYSGDQSNSAGTDNSTSENPQDEQDLFPEELFGFFGILARAMPPGAVYPRWLS